MTLRPRDTSSPLFHSARDTIINSSIDVLPGYYHVQKGDPYVTRHCRKLTQQANQVVYAAVNNFGKHIGIHVPKQIYDAVKVSQQETQADRRQAVLKHDMRVQERFRSAVLARFPRIPPDEADKITGHATAKGERRVGRTGTLPLREKALRATKAWIRHNFTDYDKFLSKGMADERAIRHMPPRDPRKAKVRDQTRKHVARDIDALVEAWGPPTAGAAVRNPNTNNL
ncbi:hypothetical protein F4808DRAFT_375573 [Astrocystis sublimbata]|nr:hypothetical protein F4808DRAFT_375573 [Astrocystis sublimbata]